MDPDPGGPKTYRYGSEHWVQHYVYESGFSSPETGEFKIANLQVFASSSVR
jgi:hypothetical protein